MEREKLDEEKDLILGPKTKETELRLGLPGDDGNWFSEKKKGTDDDHMFEVQQQQQPCDQFMSRSRTLLVQNSVGAKRGFLDTVGRCNGEFQPKEGTNNNNNNTQMKTSFFMHPSTYSYGNQTNFINKFPTNPAFSKLVKDPTTDLNIPKASSSHELVKSSNMGGAGSSSSEHRVVVGWPPIRSFRKNLASSSFSKPPSYSATTTVETKHVGPSVNGSKAGDASKKGLFVKINMDGVAIGRKVDLTAYETYEQLSVAVDELFRGLLAAQRYAVNGGQGGNREEKPITGLLDGSGEYTLVYEDDEGDKMLVGDVPWGMFVAAVKRLRVLKSTDLSGLHIGGCKGKPAATAGD